MVTCLLSQYAMVTTKIREHLKLRAGSAGSSGLVEGAGMNEGHREP